MEGDVAASYVRLLAIGLTLVGLVIGVIVGMMRWMVQRIMKDIDDRLGRMEDLTQKVAQVDNDLKRLIADMPLYYQRREDAIRDYTAINSKLDRLYEILVLMRGEKRHD